MVAASLGMPACAQSSEPSANDSPVSSLFTGNVVHFDHLIRLQESARRSGVNVDYWHQHAIRTVIRHLSFSLSPVTETEAETALPLAVQKLALIDSLQALLTSQIQPQLTHLPQSLAAYSPPSTPAVADWQAAIDSIRAGPFVA